jgi:mitochondrial protein import protein ZIM17
LELIYLLENKLSSQRNPRVKHNKRIFHIHVRVPHPLIVIVDSKDIKGPTRNRKGLLMIMFTCNVCQHRQGRTFSKDAYEVGVVLIRCEGCENLHLIADNLGWFRDEQVNIE